MTTRSAAFVIASLVFLTACHRALPKDENDVVTVMLDEVGVAQTLVVRDTTAPFRSFASLPSNGVGETEASADYDRKREETRVVHPSLAGLRFITHDQELQIFDPPYGFFDKLRGHAPDAGGGWLEFDERYPGAHQLVILSRVGFSSDGTVAVAYGESICDDQRCKHTKIEVFEKKSGRWQLRRAVDLDGETLRAHSHGP